MSEFNVKSCEQESIHIPSAIQPHGFLLEVTIQGDILHCSDNIFQFLGYMPKEIFTTGIESYSPDLIQFLKPNSKAINQPSGILNSTQIQFKHKDGKILKFDAIISKSKDGFIIESEPVDMLISTENISNSLLSSIMTVRSEENLNFFLGNITDQMQMITGYDRIMVYRFDTNWNGEVIAESKKQELLPFLGLHYPASDIPAQARKLYLTNHMRLIVDVDYKPSQLLKNPTLPELGLLDQSYSVLRSVSPIHIEYLKNMGVHATLVISIIIKEKLWGLIACHHYSPKYLSFEVRNTILLLTQFTSLKIESLLNLKRDASALSIANVRNILLDQMANSTEYLNGLVQGKATLLDFINSSGAAVVLAGEIKTLGEVPDNESIYKLIKTFENHLDLDTAFVSTSLAKLDPSWEYLKDIVSGLLMVQIKSTANLTILWFRKEVIQTVTWSGDPHKPVTVEGSEIPRIHPRKSFDLWSEEVRLSSMEWSELEIQAATDLRNSIKGTIIQKFKEISSLFTELDVMRFREEKANTSLKEKEILLKEIHHRVKNNMQVIVAMLYMQSDFNPHPDVKQALVDSQNRIKSMAIVHEILYANNSLAYIDMNDYCHELVDHMVSSNTHLKVPQINLEVQNLRFTIDKAIPCGLILNEAISNSFKYAFSDQDNVMSPTINVHMKQLGDTIEFNISDNGRGFPFLLDTKKPKTLGLTLIDALIQQIKGKVSFEKSESGGAKIQIVFSADRIYAGHTL